MESTMTAMMSMREIEEGWSFMVRPLVSRLAFVSWSHVGSQSPTLDH
jgi:hypothetical protein